MKPRKQSNRKFLIGNFLPAYVPSIRRSIPASHSSKKDGSLVDRRPEVRAERRAERRMQYTTNIEIGLIAALLITVLAFQLPLSGSSSSGWIQERLAESQTAHIERPPRPAEVETIEEVILEADPFELDAALELKLAEIQSEHTPRRRPSADPS